MSLILVSPQTFPSFSLICELFVLTELFSVVIGGVGLSVNVLMLYRNYFMM